MLLLSMLALAATAAPVTQAPGDVFAGLTGSCYAAAMPNGAVDTHCFSASEGGKLVLDVHKVVMGGKVVYSGVTAYSPAGFTYASSLGQVMPGTITRSGDTIDFVITVGGAAQKGQWKLTADGYDTEIAGTPMHYAKSGAAPAGGL